MLTLAVIAPQAATAWHEPSVPVAWGGTSATSRWASAAFATDDHHLVLEAWMKGNQKGLRRNYLEINFYREDGTLIQPWGAIIRPGYQGVYIHAENEDGVLVHQDIRQHSETSPILFVGVAIAFNWPGAITRYTGRFKVLFIEHGEVADWSWAIKGAGVTIHATDGGDRTFYKISEEFDGATLNAQVEGRPVYSARAQVGLEQAIEVRDTLAAMFGTNALISANDLTIQPAGGEARDCRTKDRRHACYFEEFSGPDVVGAGTYTLRATSIGEGNPFGDVVLAGADARLPAFPAA